MHLDFARKLQHPKTPQENRENLHQERLNQGPSSREATALYTKYVASVKVNKENKSGKDKTTPGIYFSGQPVHSPVAPATKESQVSALTVSLSSLAK